MSQLSLVIHPSSILRRQTKPIKNPGKETRILIDKMFQKLEELNGLGLAAPQVGIRKSLFVITGAGFKDAFINPKITYRSEDTQMFVEACLSIPGEQVKVKRSKIIEIEYLNRFLEPSSLMAKDELADVIQHEYDHLQGKLIIDYK